MVFILHRNTHKKMQQINSRKNIIVSISSEYFNTVVSLLLSLCFYHHEQQRNSNTPCLLWKKKIPCSPFQQTQAESRNIIAADKAQFMAHFGVTPPMYVLKFGRHFGQRYLCPGMVLNHICSGCSCF